MNEIAHYEMDKCGLEEIKQDKYSAYSMHT